MQDRTANDVLCVFGEVLFDQFPDGRRILGGAPFNVAWHLAAFGAAPLLVSRVGDDADGAEVRRAMRRHGMDSSALQTDSALPTGRVEVTFADGEPSYDIVHPSAWDAIEPVAVPGDCRLLYHGSLALRDERPRRALASLKDGAPETVFVDVNLRPPWWRRDHVLASLEGARWVKLNHHELGELVSGDTTDDRVSRFLDDHELDGLLVTFGADGAAVFTAGGEACRAQPVPALEVVDTVGAGDALASVMILGITQNWPLQAALERAQAFASAIVGRRGATVSDPAFYRSFIEAWGRETAERE